MWKHFKEAIPLYDIHLVSQGFQIPQFFDAGARRVLRFMHGLDPEVHRPQHRSLAAPGAEGSVVFIGNCEPGRVEIAEKLFHVFGNKLKIFGPLWGRFSSSSLKKSGCLGGPVYGEKYAATLRVAAVCIGLLSASNQDRITRRSYEIPGCGGCFLGQRTEEHTRLLREGKEGMFWSNTKELIEQASCLLSDECSAQKLKAAALKRSHELGFGYDHRIPKWLEFIFSNKKIADELLEATTHDN